MPVRRVSPASPVKDPERALADVEHTLDLVKSDEHLEDLVSAYSYYLDKNLRNDLADLFAKDGSMELAPRGV